MISLKFQNIMRNVLKLAKYNKNSFDRPHSAEFNRLLHLQNKRKVERKS